MLGIAQKNLALRRGNQESGIGEMLTLIFIMPILLWFIFTMLDLFFYFEARREVQNITSEAASIVAIAGGNNSIYTPGNKTIAQETKDLLWNGQRCTPSQCPQGYVPVVTCTPNTATAAMQQVSCTTRYKYRSIYGGGIFKSLAGLTNSEFTITATARSQTGF